MSSYNKTYICKHLSFEQSQSSEFKKKKLFPVNVLESYVESTNLEMSQEKKIYPVRLFVNKIFKCM